MTTWFDIPPRVYVGFLFRCYSDPHIERLLAQAAFERSLWLERVDAAELRAERVEDKLDQVLNELLADRRRPWWARWRR